VILFFQFKSSASVVSGKCSVSGVGYIVNNLLITGNSESSELAYSKDEVSQVFFHFNVALDSFSFYQ